MSTSTERKIESLLKQHRFTLVRQAKHHVYQAPTGHVFVTAATPSDWRAAERSYSVLKRVITNPPQPMVLAISEYEREQAAQLIKGQQKLQHAASGMGSGKQNRSRGTGFIYEDKKVLTAEELAHNEMLRQQAVANAHRREQKRRERRAEKLARREQAELQKQQEVAQFEEAYRPFLNVTQRFLGEYKVEFDGLCASMVAHRAWQPDSNFYEFPVPGSCDEEAEEWAHDLFDNFGTLEDKDEYMLDEVADFSKYLARSGQTLSRVVRFVERQLRESNSLGDLIRVLKEAGEKLRREREMWDTHQHYVWLHKRLHRWVLEEAQGLGWGEEFKANVFVHKDELIFVNEDDEEEMAVNFMNPANLAEESAEVATEEVPDLVAV